MNKIIHLRNHVNPECHVSFSPDRLKEIHPEANTQAGEQTFVWMARYCLRYEQNSSFSPYDKEKQLYSEMLHVCQWQKACVATSEGLSIVTFMLVPILFFYT